MNIQVTIKNVYGTEKIYPACSKSEVFAKLAGTTTLTHQSIQLIKALGYTIEVKAPSIKL
jgi:hypothetical protein